MELAAPVGTSVNNCFVSALISNDAGNAASAASAAAGERGCRSGSGMCLNTNRSQSNSASSIFTTG